MTKACTTPCSLLKYVIHICIAIVDVPLKYRIQCSCTFLMIKNFKWKVE